MDWALLVLNGVERCDAEPREGLYERDPGQKQRLPKMTWFSLLNHGLGFALCDFAKHGFGLCGVGDIKGFGFLEGQEGDEQGSDGAEEV